MVVMRDGASSTGTSRLREQPGTATAMIRSAAAAVFRRSIGNPLGEKLGKEGRYRYWGRRGKQRRNDDSVLHLQQNGTESTPVVEPSASPDYIGLETGGLIAESRSFQERDDARRGFRGGSLAVSGGRGSGEEESACCRSQLRSAFDLHSRRGGPQARCLSGESRSFPDGFQVYACRGQEPSVAGSGRDPRASGRGAARQGRSRVGLAGHGVDAGH